VLFRRIPQRVLVRWFFTNCNRGEHVLATVAGFSQPIPTLVDNQPREYQPGNRRPRRTAQSKKRSVRDSSNHPKPSQGRSAAVPVAPNCDVFGERRGRSRHPMSVGSRDRRAGSESAVQSGAKVSVTQSLFGGHTRASYESLSRLLPLDAYQQSRRGKETSDFRHTESLTASWRCRSWDYIVILRPRVP
jgi:hypothetical protein